MPIERGLPRRCAIEVVETGDVEEAIATARASRCRRALPVLPLRDMVTYPDTLTPLAVGQERSIKLVNDVLSGERSWSWSPRATPSSTSPAPTTSTRSASPASSPGCSRSPTARSGSSSRATERVRIGDFVTEEPYLVARIEPLPDEVEETPELEALTRNVQRTFSEIIEQIPYLPEELQLAVTNIDDPRRSPT